MGGGEEISITGELGSTCDNVPCLYVVLIEEQLQEGGISRCLDIKFRI